MVPPLQAVLPLVNPIAVSATTSDARMDRTCQPGRLVNILHFISSSVVQVLSSDDFTGINKKVIQVNPVTKQSFVDVRLGLPLSASFRAAYDSIMEEESLRSVY